MELVSYTDDDLWLTQALETDPKVMVELGGPWPLGEIPRIHGLRLNHISKGAWYFKLVPSRARKPLALSASGIRAFATKVNALRGGTG